MLEIATVSTNALRLYQVTRPCLIVVSSYRGQANQFQAIRNEMADEFLSRQEHYIDECQLDVQVSSSYMVETVCVLDWRVFRSE